MGSGASRNSAKAASAALSKSLKPTASPNSVSSTSSRIDNVNNTSSSKGYGLQQMRLAIDKIPQRHSTDDYLDIADRNRGECQFTSRSECSMSSDLQRNAELLSNTALSLGMCCIYTSILSFYIHT